jgi:hypothetical protein
MYLVFYSDFQNVWIRYWKSKKYLHFRTRFSHLRFVIWFFFKSWIPQIYQTWDGWRMRKGLTFLCYKNELGHKQLLLIVFGIRNYRLAISFLSIHDSILSDSWLQKWRENFLAHFINPVSYKHNVRTTILRSRSISAQSWVMLWTAFFC